MIVPVILLSTLELVFATKFPVEEYTEIARTIEGELCLTGCVNGQCIINWFGVAVSCKTYGPAPKYFTSQKMHKFSTQCLSNCGFFGYKREWCIIDTDMHWDFCSSYVRTSEHDPVAKTRYGETCITECSKQDKKYYWCWCRDFAGKRKWEYCAPPADERCKSESESGILSSWFG